MVQIKTLPGGLVWLDFWKLFLLTTCLCSPIIANSHMQSHPGDGFLIGLAVGFLVISLQVLIIAVPTALIRKLMPSKKTLPLSRSFYIANLAVLFTQLGTLLIARMMIS
jgi:hypothetical protein